MPTCNDLTTADYLLMLIQIAGIGLVLLLALELFRKGCKKFALMCWGLLKKPFSKEVEQ